MRAFIPASQLSHRVCGETGRLAGQYVEAVIITVDPEKKRLVLSGREVGEGEKRKRRRRSAWLSSRPVMWVEGTVDSIKPYGAFIKLDDGVDGLLHISQISTQRIKASQRSPDRGTDRKG